MNLDFEKIKSLTVGALTFKEADGALWFDHYTDDCIEKIKGLSDFWHTGATCTTGVRLDFTTDASRITAYTAGAGKHELRVNGALCKSEVLQKNGEISIDLPEGNNRVTLILPSHSRGGIRGVTLEGATTAERTVFERKILFIGDSITQGWNARFDSCSYAYITGENLRAESLIQGVGGIVFHKDLFDNNDFEPDLILIAYGCNDFGYYKTTADLKEGATIFMDHLCARYEGVKKVGIVPIWRQDEGAVKEMGDFGDCRRTINEVYDSHGVTTVDGFTLVPHLPEFYADTVHPNDLGFAEMAKNLTGKLLEIL